MTTDTENKITTEIIEQLEKEGWIYSSFDEDENEIYIPSKKLIALKYFISILDE
jgi:hypothetical protein